MTLVLPNSPSKFPCSGFFFFFLFFWDKRAIFIKKNWKTTKTYKKISPLKGTSKEMDVRALVRNTLELVAGY